MTNVFRTLMAFALLGLGSCGPKDTIPNAPTHPANPNAPTGQAPSETPTEEAPVEQPDTPPPAEDDKQAIAAAEKAAFERAKPIFEKHCAMCHSSKGAKSSKKKLGHFNIDSYPFGGHHASEIGATVREVLGVTGEEPTMPMNAPGSVKGDELDIIVEWSKAFDRSHAAGLHQQGEGHGHGDHH